MSVSSLSLIAGHSNTHNKQAAVIYSHSLVLYDFITSVEHKMITIILKNVLVFLFHAEWEWMWTKAFKFKKGQKSSIKASQK